MVGTLLLEAMMMTGCRFNSPDSSAGPSASGVAPATTQPPFVGKPNAAWLVVSKVGPEPRKRSAGAGLLAVGYELSIEVKEALPAIEPKAFVLLGEKGEGPEAGALGLQDWLPSQAGQEFVVALDPARMSNAKNMIYLGGGPDAAQTWGDCKQFYGCLGSAGRLNAPGVAAAIAKRPPPFATFFRLIFDYDRTVYDQADVCRATGAYLAERQIPPLERRKAVAHYLPKPGTDDPAALRELSAGMLRLALHLQGGGQAASAGVIFQRIDAFFADPTTGTYSIEPPGLEEKERKAVGGLLVAPTAGVDRAIQERVRKWVSGGAPTSRP
ncbi:MAG: hypothetical protein ACE5I3_06910 [Phycisphaerae bacterium]